MVSEFDIDREGDFEKYEGKVSRQNLIEAFKASGEKLDIIQLSVYVLSLEKDGLREALFESCKKQFSENDTLRKENSTNVVSNFKQFTLHTIYSVSRTVRANGFMRRKQVETEFVPIEQCIKFEFSSKADDSKGNGYIQFVQNRVGDDNKWEIQESQLGVDDNRANFPQSLLINLLEGYRPIDIENVIQTIDFSSLQNLEKIDIGTFADILVWSDAYQKLLQKIKGNIMYIYDFDRLSKANTKYANTLKFYFTLFPDLEKELKEYKEQRDSLQEFSSQYFNKSTKIGENKSRKEPPVEEKSKVDNIYEEEKPKAENVPSPNFYNDTDSVLEMLKKFNFTDIVTWKEFIKRYRLLIREYHPDLNPNDGHAVAKSQELNDMKDKLEAIYEKYNQIN